MKHGGVCHRVILLLLAEGLAVSALVHSGICFVDTNQDTLQRAVVGIITVVGALMNGAFDALVCMAAHKQFLLLIGLRCYCAQKSKNPFMRLQFTQNCDMVVKTANDCLQTVRRPLVVRHFATQNAVP